MTVAKVITIKSYNAIFLFSRVKVRYRGKASHAAAFPWDGVNALDAAVMAYTGISALRQQFGTGWKIHGKWPIVRTLKKAT